MMRLFFRGGLVLATLCTSACLFAQDHRLLLHPDTLIEGLRFEPVDLRSSALVQDELRAVLGELQQRGHLEASVDTCSYGTDSTSCALHIGPVYRWAQLTAGGIDQEIASQARFRERYFRGRPIEPAQVARLFEELLDLCEDHGFPFAVVSLDSIRSTEEGLRGSVHLDRGRLVRIDSVIVKGSAKVEPRFLWSQIGIQPGDLYSETLIAGAEQRLHELPFVTQRQRPYVLFNPEQAKLYLFLDARRASSVNGILGVQPDPASGKVKFTGDLDLRLRNALRHGEAIELNWRSLADQSQDLKVRFNYPFLFNTPFGTDLSLKLFKRDTTFLEVNTRAAIEYLFGLSDKLSVFVNNKSSRRLGRLDFAPAGLADVELLSYGLGVERQRFDYRFNPRRGLGLKLDGSAGNKRTSTATTGETNTQEQETLQVEVNGELIVHVPIGRRGTVRLAGQGGWMASDLLYVNELYRIGGLKTLRGADEASIYASAFSIGTIELRYLFEENSNAFIFFDQGWWEDQSRLPLVTDTPFGFGVGTSFETKAGIFSLTYALGRQFDNPIELRAGKVHFGFTSLF